MSMKKDEWLKVLQAYAKQNKSIKLNPNQEHVKGIIDGVFSNEKKYGKKWGSGGMRGQTLCIFSRNPVCYRSQSGRSSGDTYIAGRQQTLQIFPNEE